MKNVFQFKYIVEFVYKQSSKLILSDDTMRY